MNYKKYTDEEIMESYNTMLEYSGKADRDILIEIESRGGINQLKKNIDELSIVPNEIKRINKEVFKIYKEDANPEKIKAAITSDILSTEKLNLLIDSAIDHIEIVTKDTAISSRTIIGCVFGTLLSTFLGALLWYYSIVFTGRMYFILTVGILIVSYIIIRILTNQSRNNTLVFIASFTSAFFAIILGLWFYKLATE